MINIMDYSEWKLRKNGVALEENHTYEICSFTMKNIYSYSQAQQMMKSMKHCRNRNHNKVYLRSYKCKRCNGWHLTSEKPFQYREERRTIKEKKLAS